MYTRHTWLLSHGVALGLVVLMTFTQVEEQAIAVIKSHDIAPFKEA